MFALLVNIEMVTCRARVSSRSGDWGEIGSMVYARQTRAVARQHLDILLPH
jgi:hypothetical protein